MKPLIRFGLAGVALAGLAWCVLLNNAGIAGGNKKLAGQIDGIAAALQSGKKDAAMKLTKTVAKQQGEVYEPMLLFKPRAKHGIGVGPKANQIVPDGIEQLIRVFARDAPSKAKITKHKDALVQMGYRTAAIADIAIALTSKQNFNKKKTKAKWQEFCKEMNESAHQFVKAVKSGSPAEVKKAASSLDSACNRCHSVFRD